MSRKLSIKRIAEGSTGPAPSGKGHKAELGMNPGSTGDKSELKAPKSKQWTKQTRKGSGNRYTAELGSGAGPVPPSNDKLGNGQAELKGAANEAPPAVGTMNDLKGTVLKGLGKTAQKISFKNSGVPSSVDMPGGYGLLQTTNKNHLVSTKPNKVPKVNMVVREGVIDGTVQLRIGRKTITMEAASPKVLRSIASSYAGAGTNVEISVNTDIRESAKDRNLINLMLLAAHYKHHGMTSKYKAKVKEGYEAFKKLVDREYSPFYHESKKDWINECVKPSYKNLFRRAGKKYDDLLETHEVSVRAVTKDGEEEFKTIIHAIDEDHAVYEAFNLVVAETGVTTKVKRAFIGSKKFLPEEANESSLFSTDTKFFDDMYTAGKPKFDDMGRGKHGESSETKADKPKKETTGGKLRGNAEKVTFKHKGGTESKPKMGTDPQKSTPQKVSEAALYEGSIRDEVVRYIRKQYKSLREEKQKVADQVLESIESDSDLKGEAARFLEKALRNVLKMKAKKAA